MIYDTVLYFRIKDGTFQTVRVCLSLFLAYPFSDWEPNESLWMIPTWSNFYDNC